MKKTIIRGLNAVAAFALMFALTLNVAAQDRVETATDKVEVKESVESNVTKLNRQTENLTKVNALYMLRNLQSGIYFRYTGTPGNESNPALWEEVSSPTGCEGSQLACVVMVKPSFTTGSSPNRSIDASALTAHGYAGLMPVQPTSSGNIPNPNAAGEDEVLPYVSEEEIYNKN